MTVSDKADARLDDVRRAEDAALAAIKAGRPLAEVLNELVLAMEAGAEVEMLGSVLLVSEDGKHLVHGAGPSLPAAYNEAVDGIAIGPGVGSCGTAAFYGEPVFVTDIRSDPLWIDFKEIAHEHGLRACWSLPVKDSEGRVVATLASYYREPRHPRAADYEAIRIAADTVRQVIALSHAALTA